MLSYETHKCLVLLLLRCVNTMYYLRDTDGEIPRFALSEDLFVLLP